MKERQVGVRELKSNLSSVLRQVKSGQIILITERGRPVGRILPAEMTIEETLQDGVRRRLWAWNGRKWQPASSKLQAPGVQISDLLLEDRE